MFLRTKLWGFKIHEKYFFKKIIKIKQSLQNAFPRKLKQYRDIFANEMCLKIFNRVASRQLQKNKIK